MDGVIIDSNPLHRISWTEYMRRHGVEMTDAMQRQMYGKRNDELIREFFGSQLTEREVFAHGAAKEALYRDMMKPQTEESLVPGIREFLARHRNLKFGLATNAEPANVDFVLDNTGLRSAFDVIVSGHEVVNPKPHPEIYLRVADLLECRPDECVVFEDSSTGVAAGIAAGMRVVGVGTTHDELPGVSLFIRDFSDPGLEKWLAGTLRPEPR